jgi:hypothetical protein
MLGPYLLGQTAHHFGYPFMFLIAGGIGAMAAVCLIVNPSNEEVTIPVVTVQTEA